MTYPFVERDVDKSTYGYYAKRPCSIIQDLHKPK